MQGLSLLIPTLGDNKQPTTGLLLLVCPSAYPHTPHQPTNRQQDDVHRVFAPGRIFFIKRLDKHMGRAKYGNTVHKCALCESDDAVPPADPEHEHTHVHSDVSTFLCVCADPVVVQDRGISVPAVLWSTPAWQRNSDSQSCHSAIM